MVSIAKAHSAFTSQSIAAWERVVSVYFFLYYTCQPRDHLTRARSDTQTQCMEVQGFNNSTPVRSRWSRPHDKYSLQYLYCNRQSTIILFGSRPSGHYFRSVCLSVCLFVCV